MKKISRRSFLLASGALAAAALAGCGSAAPASSAADSAAAKPTIHPPITILTASRDYSAFLKLLHTSYPEINVQFIAYRGQNTSAYMKKQLETGCMPDIYTTTYPWDGAVQAEHLIDLSRYSITDCYIPAQMAQTDVDGATYLLPYDYTVQAIGYNKTLFAQQGWAVPQSFAEVQALLPAIRAAGVTPAVCQLSLPGIGFREFCNIADTVFLNTLEGRRWQEEFLAGRADAASGLQSSAAVVQQWIDAGLLNMDHPAFDDHQANELFREGQTAFLVGSLERTTQNEDGTGDQYGILPYLSPDGTTNTYALQTLRYYGLSKTLEQPGNEQKLEDALHFLELLSTVEGYNSIVGSSAPLCALRDFTVPSDSVYQDALTLINSGHSAPFLYAGWEEPAVTFGNAVRSWAAGRMTGAEALAVLDATQQQYLASGTPVYATVSERLTTQQTAQLIGQMYISQTGADAALISYNVWKPNVSALYENVYGVSGELLPGGLTEQDIVSVLPTGWYGNIPLIQLAGSRIRELALTGFDQNRDGDTYPYVLLTRNGKPLENDTLYTVAYAGLNSATAAAVPLLDSGVPGLAAAKNYFRQTGVISSVSLW